MIILGKSEGVISMILDNLESIQNWRVITIVNNLQLPDKYSYANKLFGTIKEVDTIEQANQLGLNIEGEFILGGYNPKVKRELYELLAIPLSSRYINVIHKSAQISSTANLWRGIIVNSNVSVAAHTVIQNHVTINRNASVGHHTIIEEFVSISPSATICGRCKIGRGSLIGAGAVIIDGITIGENSIIGAGSVVTKDLPANSFGYGNPFLPKYK